VGSIMDAGGTLSKPLSGGALGVGPVQVVDVAKDVRREQRQAGPQACAFNCTIMYEISC